MQTITKASVTEAGQQLRSKLVAYCTSGALVIHPAVRALVGEHNLIMEALTVKKAQAIIEYCELNGHTLGGWLEALICWVADCTQLEVTQANPANRFLARAQFVRELAELLEIPTNGKGDLVFTNPAKTEMFFDQLGQYDAEIASK